MERCRLCGTPSHKLDDWGDGRPDGWDYNAVLFDNRVRMHHDPFYGWSMSWKHGTMGIGLNWGQGDLAHKAAALFVELWLRGVSASFADKLMDAYILLERS